MNKKLMGVGEVPSAASAVLRLRRVLLFTALCLTVGVLWRLSGQLQLQLSPHSLVSRANDTNFLSPGGGSADDEGPSGSPPRDATIARTERDDAGGGSDRKSARRGKRAVGDRRDEFDGFVVLRDQDSASAAAQREDLRRCFSPLYVADNGRLGWEARRANTKYRNVTCDIRGIGAFRVTKCFRKDICFLVSRDVDDHGARYFMKLGQPLVLRKEAEIVRHLSHSKRSRDLTAKPHPRYPYLQWKMTDHKKSEVAVVITEQLNFTRGFKSAFSKRTSVEEVLSEETVQCWEDVMSVMETLWKFRGGHFIHNDVHSAQILPIGSGNGTFRCHVIDFGMVHSLDHKKTGVRKDYANPFWYAALHNATQRIAYVREHGAAEFRRQGWESSVTRWGQLVFLKRLMYAAYGVDPFPGWADREEDGAVPAKWCRAAEMMVTLVNELEQGADGGGGPLVNAAALRMVVKQATIIESGVAAAMNCSVPEAVPKSPGQRG